MALDSAANQSYSPVLLNESGHVVTVNSKCCYLCGLKYYPRAKCSGRNDICNKYRKRPITLKRVNLAKLTASIKVASITGATHLSQVIMDARINNIQSMPS